MNRYQEITITARTTWTAESEGSIEFTLSSTHNFGQDFRVRFDPSEFSGGDFLDENASPSQEADSEQEVDFSDPAGTGTYEATLSVPIHNDGDGERTGQIQVTLLPDDNAVHTYRVESNGTQTVKATILDDDAPELKISAVGPVTEGSGLKAKFTITSEVPVPNNTLTVNYTPVSTNFIETGSGSPTTTVPALTFTGAGPYTAPLEITVHDDTNIESNDTIRVTLNNDSPLNNTYTVAPPDNNFAEVMVKDDDTLPLLTITTPTNSIVESAGMIDFTITATTTAALPNNPGDDFRVRYDPSEVGTGNFLNEFASPSQEAVTSAEIDFTGSGNTFSATLSVPIHNDSAGERTGEIQVTLLPDDVAEHNYRVAKNASDTVKAKILDDDAPELTITAGSAVTEGDGNDAEFTITSQVPIPNLTNQLTINYTPESDDFIQTGSGTQTFLTRTFSSISPYTTTIPITVYDNNTIDDNGSITVTLHEESNPGDTYTVASSPKNSATVSVLDNDGFPLLSITGPEAPVPENDGSIFFVVTAPSAQTLTVRYQASEVDGGDFLTPAQAAEKSAPLSFDQVGGTGPFINRLSVQIHNDSDGENTGRIKVTLLPGIK